MERASRFSRTGPEPSQDGRCVDGGVVLQANVSRPDDGTIASRSLHVVQLHHGEQAGPPPDL